MKDDATLMSDAANLPSKCVASHHRSSPIFVNRVRRIILTDYDTVKRAKREREQCDGDEG